MNSAGNNNTVSFTSLLNQVQEAKKAAKVKDVVRTYHTMNGVGIVLDFSSCK
jgi:hypothetical protein